MGTTYVALGVQLLSLLEKYKFLKNSSFLLLILPMDMQGKSALQMCTFSPEKLWDDIGGTPSRSTTSLL
jgi:hypothetical protein